MKDEGVLAKCRKLLCGKWAFVLLAAAGLLLLLLGSGQSATAQQTGQDIAARSEEYRLMLTEELTALCGRVRGVGSIKLVITLVGGEEAIYATDSSEEGRTDYVLSGGEGLLLYRKNPTVLGVGVVCAGGDDPTVRAELSALLSATLGIGCNRIHISCG